jgi:putative CocE/NonD family hydrolase
MTMYKRTAALLALIFLSSGISAMSAEEDMTWKEVREAYVGETEEKILVPMRDGVRLDTNIFFPRYGEPPYPAVLIRSPYQIDYILERWMKSGWIQLFLENGYAIIFQNERGRYWSEGKYTLLAGAREDGYDAIDWIVKQDWSNGKVGTFGCSSSGEHQLGLATMGHPGHAAAVAGAPGAGIGIIGDFYEQGNFYEGGAIQLLFASWYNDWVFYGGSGHLQKPGFPGDLSREERIRLSRIFPLRRSEPQMDYREFFRHLPVADLIKNVNGPVTDWERFSRRTPGDPAWSRTDFAGEDDTFGVPMLWIFSWYDIGVAPNIALYNHAREHTSSKRAKGNQFMVMSPMPHCAYGRETVETIVGDRKLGDARFDYDALFLDWFDYWLKGEKTEVLKQPRVYYYLMGANEWQSGDAFPPEETEAMAWYLDSGGHANSLLGDGTLSTQPVAKTASDTFIYDPLVPVPTLGGGACCQGGEADPGSFDQTSLEARIDVLVYTSPPLEEDLEVTGFIETVLHVSSDARDTDFTVKLVDVDTESRAWNLQDTVLRARYREGYDRTVFMTEGEVYEIRLGPMATANTFQKGHRIRIEISSSNFPRLDRNLNTGGNNFDESKPRRARNTVHHSPEHRSRIVLPVATAGG